MSYGDLKVNNLIYDTGSGDASRSVVSIPLSASPTFTGVVTIPTPAAGDNTTKAASTAYVQTELADYAALAGATFTGTINATSLVLSADLTVNGTTTTINTSVLDVEDKNITLGKVSTPSDTTADGGGITLKGSTDKTWNWVDATDAWTSNQHIHIGDIPKFLLGTDQDAEINHNGSNLYIQNTTGNININAKASETAILCVPDGAVELYHDNSKKIETTAVGVTVTGSVTDDKGDVRSIPANVQTGAYTLVASDAGKFIRAQGAITVPNNLFSAGDAVTIVNNTGSDIAINQGIGFMYMTSDASTGNRVLAGRGMASILFVTANICYISGGGLS